MVNESLEDSLLDLATYSIIALQLYREENPPLKNPLSSGEPVISDEYRTWEEDGK